MTLCRQDLRGGGPISRILPPRRGHNGVEGGVPEEGDREAFEWKMDEGSLYVLYVKE